MHEFTPSRFEEERKDFLDFSWKEIEQLPDNIASQKQATLCVTGCEKLLSLKGSPEEVLTLRAKGTKALKSLVGGPKRVMKSAYFQDSGIESLEGLLEVRNSLYVADCSHLKSLHGVGTTCLKSCSSLYLSPYVVSDILGLMLVKDLSTIEVFTNTRTNKELEQAIKIIIKHKEYKADPDLIDCQHELIEAGLEEYAEL